MNCEETPFTFWVNSGQGSFRTDFLSLCFLRCLLFKLKPVPS
jgi:hypothetical protein